MADLNRTIAIIFNGEDNISAPMAKMEKKISSFSRNVSDSVAPLHSASTAILTLNAALAALAVGGLIMAFNESKKYEQATIELKKVMGEGEGITHAMEDSFTELSRAYGISTTAIVESLAGLRQSGFDTSESMEILNTSLALSRASELSVEESTTMLKRSLIGYRLEAEKAVVVGDLWNHASQAANTTVSDLAQAFAIVSRQSLNAGFSLKQTAAALAPVVGVFGSGKDAGIAFSTALTSILDPTARGEAGIRLLTGATGPLNEEFASGAERFEAVARGLNNVSKETGLVAVAQIVGKDQAKRMQVAFEDYYETLGKMGTEADRYNSLQKEVDLQNKSAVASVDKLKVGFSELLRAIGDEYREAGKAAIDGTTAIEHALEDLVKGGAFDEIFAAINDFSFKIGETFEDIAKRLPDAFKNVDFDGLLDAMGEVGDSVSGLFDGMDLSTTEGLIAAVQAVIDTFTSLANVTGGIIKSLGLVIKPFELLLTTFNNLSPAAQSLVGNILGLGTALTVMSGVVAVGGVLIGGLKTLAVLISGPVGLTIGLAALGTALAKITVDHFAKQAAETASAIHEWNMEVADLTLAIAKIPPSKTTEIETLIAAGELEEARDLVDELVEEERIIHIKIESDITKEQAEWEKFKDAWGSFSEAKTIELTALANTGDFEAIEKMIAGLGVDPVEIQAELEAASKQKTEDDLKKLTEAKEIEIKLKGEIDKQIAQIISSAEVAQSAFEWSAKIDIAEAEAAATTTKAAFDSVGDSVVALSASTSDMFGALVGSMDNLSVLQQWDFMDILEDQQDAQNEALRTQSLLAEAQTEYVEARTKALKKGGGDIKISSDGLEPSLQMIMWQILEKVQLKANESAADFLMGINL